MTRSLLLFLAVSLASAPAYALSPRSSMTLLAQSPTTQEPLRVSTSETALAPSWGLMFGAGAAATLVAVPGSLYLASALGTLSNSLLFAALPSLLVMGLIPPLAVTFATWLVGNWKAPGMFRVWPTFLATLLTNTVALIIAGFAGMNVGALAGILLFTLVQAAVEPAVATTVMRTWPRKPLGPTALANGRPDFAPSASIASVIF